MYLGYFWWVCHGFDHGYCRISAIAWTFEDVGGGFEPNTHRGSTAALLTLMGGELQEQS